MSTSSARLSLPPVLMAALAATLVAVGLAAAGLGGADRALGATASGSSAAAPTTWVVDAVDDAYGNSWESRDTGTSVVTIQVGDTVEWRFEWPVAGQEHDLTSQDTASTWPTKMQEYRVPDDPLGPVRYTFTTPGVYDYICSIHGSMMTGTVVVEEAGSAAPLTAEASAAPNVGSAPLDVAFTGTSAYALAEEVTTQGPLLPFSAGTATYPGLSGTATMVRRRGETTASIDVGGLKPSASHMVHVHEEACSSHDGSAHFRFDTRKPFAADNELWLPFTSDASGGSGPIEVTKPQRAGPDAVSIVIHDPDNMARRIGCADLTPDLAYAWSFGDGTTGAGQHPRHTYAAGSWTATLTVTDDQGNIASDSVVVTATGPAVSPPSVPPTAVAVPPAPPLSPVDRTGPSIRKVRPGTATTDRTPTVRAQVTDELSAVRPRSLVLRLDGDRVGRVRWDARRDRLTWTPRRALTVGRHTVRLVAVDTAGNRSVRRWSFRVRA